MGLQRSGEVAGRIAVIAAAPGLETGAAALRLARALAEKDARVVLVGLGGDDDKIRTISNDPTANGMFELLAGRASFRDIITKDRLPASISSFPVAPPRIASCSWRRRAWQGFLPRSGAATTMSSSTPGYFAA